MSLSRWLLTRPQLLIFDESTCGINVGAHTEIIRLTETLCVDGLALPAISFELEELVGHADRVIVIRNRRQVAEIPLTELSVSAIMNAIVAQGEQYGASISPGHYTAEKAFSLTNRNAIAGGTVADTAG